MPSEDPQSFRSRSAASPRRTNGGDAPSRQPPASRHCMYDYPYAQCLTDPRIQSRRSLSDAYQRDAGAYHGLSPVKRGPKLAEPNPLAAEHAQLLRDNKRLTLRLERAEAVIAIQKKVALLLGLPATDEES